MRINSCWIVGLACLAMGANTTQAQQTVSGPLDWNTVAQRGDYIGPLDQQMVAPRPALEPAEPVPATQLPMTFERPTLEPIAAADPIASHSVLVDSANAVRPTSNLTLVPTLAVPRQENILVRPQFEVENYPRVFPIGQQEIVPYQAYPRQVVRLYSPLDGPYVRFQGMPTVLPNFGTCDCCDEWENFGQCGGLKARPGHWGIPWLRSQDDCDQGRGCGCGQCRTGRWSAPPPF